MRPFGFYVLSSVLIVLFSSVSSAPVKFEDDQSLEESGRSLTQQEESRRFHGHAIRKRKKKKLLHCLLNLQRSKPRADARTLFFNYVNLEYTQHGGGNGGYNDDSGGGGYNDCLNQLGGGNYGGSDGGSDGGSNEGSSGLGEIGEGINNLSSLVGQVPSNIITSVGDGIKPVFENSERYFNRYIIRPLYRSLRPLYRLF